MSRILYHVSPISNRLGIRKYGILAMKAKGSRSVNWLCDLRRLPHYMAHIAEHHDVGIDHLDIYMVDATLLDLRQYRPGVFTTVDDIEPDRLTRVTSACLR